MHFKDFSLLTPRSRFFRPHLTLGKNGKLCAKTKFLKKEKKRAKNACGQKMFEQEVRAFQRSWCSAFSIYCIGQCIAPLTMILIIGSVSTKCPALALQFFSHLPRVHFTTRKNKEGKRETSTDFNRYYRICALFPGTN